jgi:hypothetical protein
MKLMSEMTTAELAAYIQSHLRYKGIEVVLTGGSVVSIYSQQKYVSKDLDFVVIGYWKSSRIREAMEEINFQRIGRHYESSETDLLVEFPGGPLSIFRKCKLNRRCFEVVRYSNQFSKRFVRYWI